MTPAEHLTVAEGIITAATGHYARGDTAEAAWRANLAVAHALIALGAQLGVPHQHLAAVGGDGGGAPLR